MTYRVRGWTPPPEIADLEASFWMSDSKSARREFAVSSSFCNEVRVWERTLVVDSKEKRVLMEGRRVEIVS